MTKFDNEFIFDMTIKRYDQEFSRYQHIDQKAGTQIGFAGIIMAVLGFIFGSNEFVNATQDVGYYFLVSGMALLLIAIGIAIMALIHYKKALPVFLPEKFYDKYKDESEIKQKEEVLLAYFDFIYSLEVRNNFKAKLLHYGNIVTLGGLTLSFISFLYLIKLVG